MYFYLKTKTNNLPILLMQYNKNNNNLIFPDSITKEKKILHLHGYYIYNNRY